MLGFLLEGHSMNVTRAPIMRSKFIPRLSLSLSREYYFSRKIFPRAKFERESLDRWWCRWFQLCLNITGLSAADSSKFIFAIRNGSSMFTFRRFVVNSHCFPWSPRNRQAQLNINCTAAHSFIGVRVSSQKIESIPAALPYECGRNSTLTRDMLQ